MGAWKIIIPETATNLCLNPVAMGTGNYADVGTPAITIVTTTSYFGYKSYRVVTDADNEGISLTLHALANAVHYVTVRTNGAPLAAWDWNLDGATFNVPTLLGTEGDWYVYGFQFPAVECSGHTALQILTRGVAINNWQIGHVQVEENTHPTTPITGAMKGFTPKGYSWNGTPHAASSVRTSQERSGGVEVDLEDSYNFKVMYAMGTGMPPITHHVQGMALLPGSMYVGHKVEPRILDLVSAIKETATTSIAHARKHFIEATKLDATVYEQPVVFRYYGNAAKPVEFHGVYDSGMEFQTTSGVVDKPVARFICYDPFAYEVHDTSKVLERSLEIVDADYCVRRNSGVWSNISTDFDGDVRAIVKGKDGCIYIGGNFTMGASKEYIVKWDPYTSALSALGTGMDGVVYALAVAPNGDIYAGGAFNSAGGVAETDHIAYWDISAGAWVSVSATHPSSDVRVLAFDHSGNLFVGGGFTNLGDANGDYIVKWTGAAWASLGTGADDLVLALACAPNGDMYATGLFTLAGGVAGTAYIAKWNGTAWLPLGVGFSGGGAIGYALAIDSAGNVYVGGGFTVANGVSCNRIAKWNGQTFEPLGTGLSAQCYSLALDSDEKLYAGGLFATAGGLALADKFAVWNGTTWMQPDIDLPGAATVFSTLLVPPIGYSHNDDIYLGYDTAGTANSGRHTTIDIPTTNPGSKYIYPVLHIYRADDGTSAKLSSLENVTTGKTLYFDYSLQKGETLTIDLTPGNRSVKSDFYGDVWRAVLRGSDFASFGLLGGTNIISLFIIEVGAPTVVAWLEWRSTHWAADTAAL